MDLLSTKEDAFVFVTINDARQEIDLFREYNRLLDLGSKARDAHPGEGEQGAMLDAYHESVCALLDELGFGRVSHRIADQFDKAVFRAFEELGKAPADAPTPA